MTTITLVFGALLTLIGLADFFYAGMHSPALLFPCLLGILLIICSLVSTDPKLHRQAMKGAALVALLGFAATVTAFGDLLFSLKKVTFATHSEMIANSATALLCLIFLTRCFQEFLVSQSRKKE
jgi:putative effector of murein hydrolase